MLLVAHILHKLSEVSKIQEFLLGKFLEVDHTANGACLSQSSTARSKFKATEMLSNCWGIKLVISH